MTGLAFSLDDITAWVSALLWPLFRVAALFSIMPVLGEGRIPVRVRVGLAFLVTLLIAPSLAPMPPVDPLSVDGMLITLQQIVIGVGMGLLLQLVFNAVMVAGESIAITMGLGFAVMNDPQNGISVPSISQFYLLIGTLLFLALNGHHAALEMMASSFTLIPVGQALGADANWQLLELGSVIFRGALAIALPGLAAMLTINMILGVMTRSAPALNIFSVGFPMTMTVGFVSILLTLPAFGTGFETLLNDMYASIVDVLSR